MITVHGSQGINAVFKYISKNEEDRVFTAKLMGTDEINGWKKFTFKLLTKLKAVKNNTRSIIELSSIKIPYNIGEIKFVKGKKVSDSIKCTLENSSEMIPTDQYYLNIKIESKLYKRLLVLISNVGMFAYFR